MLHVFHDNELVGILPAVGCVDGFHVRTPARGYSIRLRAENIRILAETPLQALEIARREMNLDLSRCECTYDGKAFTYVHSTWHIDQDTYHNLFLSDGFEPV